MCIIHDTIVTLDSRIEGEWLNAMVSILCILILALLHDYIIQIYGLYFSEKARWFTYRPHHVSYLSVIERIPINCCRAIDEEHIHMKLLRLKQVKRE